MTERPTGTDYDYCTHTILHMSEWVFVHKKNYGMHQLESLTIIIPSDIHKDDTYSYGSKHTIVHVHKKITVHNIQAMSVSRQAHASYYLHIKYHLDGFR